MGIEPDIADAARKLYEGARPTIERLALVSRQAEDALTALAEHEGWRPLPEADALRRRIAAMSGRVLGLIEDADGDELTAKPRIDAVTALIKAIDKLKEVADCADDRQAAPPDETELKVTFAAIDRRIEELAHAYAERLVEEASGGRPER
ncbi:MAG: hypothetical protein MUC58_12755 [Rhizobiaceae bacterium]|nr:hypothetical protein [Rhizobiaceae bacterium]